ncbi:MAG: type II restriction endonuclease [Bacteroidetes bacterium]|nr:type II restriction endonuclease [Bacteroidota bacterium]
MRKKRLFSEWIETFTDTIANYNYFIDFQSICNNADKYKLEINMMNSLVGNHNIEKDFIKLIKKYPEVINCIPTLLAVRANEISILDNNGNKYLYNFDQLSYSPEQYAVFMKETGLFELLENKIIKNLYDYVLGVETGLNSNARKNRSGHIMVNLVENFIIKTGYKKEESYFKEMNSDQIITMWNLDVPTENIINKEKKRFDFVVKTNKYIYGIETNFYHGGGSKLNETARSYKLLAEELNKIKGFKFIWITDGYGWKTVRNGLEDAFNTIENIYNINDIKNGILKKLLK